MRKLVSATFVASMLAVGAAAQGQQPTEGQQPTQGQQPRQQSQAAPAKVTVSGCIQNAPAAPGGTAGATGAATTRAKFILADAKMVSGGAAGGGAVGTAGTAATRYQLEGEEKEISAHLNQQVEVTGMVSAPAAGTGSQAGAAAAAPTLKIDSVKMVAAKCP